MDPLPLKLCKVRIDKDLSPDLDFEKVHCFWCSGFFLVRDGLLGEGWCLGIMSPDRPSGNMYHVQREPREPRGAGEIMACERTTRL